MVLLILDMLVSPQGEVRATVDTHFPAPQHILGVEAIVYEAVIGDTTGVPYWNLSLTGKGMHANSFTNNGQTGSIFLSNNQFQAQPDGAGGQFYFNDMHRSQIAAWVTGLKGAQTVTGRLSVVGPGPDGHNANEIVVPAAFPSRITLLMHAQ